MALENKKYIHFKNAILKALDEIGSNELKYISEWIYLYPTHSLEVNNIMIEQEYSIPMGWDGYNIKDLQRMVDEGLLEIQSESEKDPITFEKQIIFKLIDD